MHVSNNIMGPFLLGAPGLICPPHSNTSDNLSCFKQTQVNRDSKVNLKFLTL